MTKTDNLNVFFTKKNCNTEFIRRNIYRPTEVDATNKNPTPVTAVTIPYIKGTSEIISRILPRQERWRLPIRKRAVNLCKTWRLLTFTGVHQSENPWFSSCFTVGEFEYSFHYPVVSLYGERRKTLVFWN